MTIYEKCKFSILMLCIDVVLFGCTNIAVAATKPHNYSDKNSNNSIPKSILILPPLSNGSYGSVVLLNAAKRLVNAGYYVFSVGLVDQTFRYNGRLTSVNDSHTEDLAKLRDVFGADAALYININEYPKSCTWNVDLNAKLVDLRTGGVIWTGVIHKSNEEKQKSDEASFAEATAFDPMRKSCFDTWKAENPTKDTDTDYIAYIAATNECSMKAMSDPVIPPCHNSHDSEVEATAIYNLLCIGCASGIGYGPRYHQ